MHRYRFPDRAAARRAIFGWINRCNRQRFYSSIGHIPPIEWENKHRQAQADLATQPT